MIKTFKANGTFGAYYEACGWLSDNGYSYGSMCIDQPIGIMKGDWGIAKWKNLTSSEKKEVDGRMTSNDSREGNVTINIPNHEEN